MATFEARVEGLTGLAIESANSNPTQDQLSEFLKDGVTDIVDRWTTMKPQDAYLFARSSSTSDSQAAHSANSGKVISVIRESGTADDWRECTKITLGMQSRVTDQDSLFYSSAYNPAYVISEDGAVLVYPAPEANNGYKIYYVNAEPRDAAGNNILAYSHSDIKFFPEEKVRLVILYAGMRSLQSVMAGMHINVDINAAFANFKSNMLSGINQLDFSQTATDRIDENLYNALNFDAGRGRFKEVIVALKKANDLLDGPAPATGYNAFSYHLREDPELVGSALNMSATELKNAQSIVAELSAMEELALKESQSYLAIAAAYIQDAERYLTQVQTLSNEDNKEYSWYDSRYREIKSEYDQAFGLVKQQQQQQQQQGAR
jgi:hypothetical protein